MIVQPEYSGATVVQVIRANSFEGAASIVEAVRQYRDFGIRIANELTIHPNELAIGSGTFSHKILSRFELGTLRHRLCCW
jgi:hypothetical protein